MANVLANDPVEALIYVAAKVAHEVNRAYCVAALDDHSQPSWEDAPQWQRDSAAAGVRAFIARAEISPEELHESWLAHKAADGWAYGPVKDVDNKLHPCMVPYDQLPKEQRIKDHLFRASVASVL